VDLNSLREAVRPLLPATAELRGAFEVHVPCSGESGFGAKSVVAWSTDEVFVLTASSWWGAKLEVVGRLPLTAAMMPTPAHRPQWDGEFIFIGGALYLVRRQHAVEADRFSKAWRSAVQGQAQRSL